MVVETVRITPDYRNLGKYQFVTGWTGGGAEMCTHLTFEQVMQRFKAKHGPGKLEDDGTDLVWLQDEVIGIPKLAGDSLDCSGL